MGALDLGALNLVSARARPVSEAQTRVLPVPAPLVPLLPDGGLRRGSTVAVGPLEGGCSLALALAGAVTTTGGWVAGVGLPSLGLVAAAELGVELRRFALIPAPGGQWAAVVAALLDGFDLMLLHPPGRVRAPEARRLTARVRERGAVMVLLDVARWPESPDVTLSVGPTEWEGLGRGHGCLTARRMEVCAGGRRVGGRERRRTLWLPAPPGSSSPVAPVPVAPVERGVEHPARDGTVAAAG